MHCVLSLPRVRASAGETPHRALPRARGKTAIFIATLTVFCSRSVQEKRKRRVIFRYRRCLRRESQIRPIERTVGLLYSVYIADFLWLAQW